jgi:branched-subunit amino acid transport protein
MSPVWLAVLVVGAATMAIKAIGPVFLGGRELPPRVGSVVSLAAPALLAALVVTQAVGGDRKLVFDARLVGLAAAVVAIRLRAPLVAVMVVAAATTALVRVAS